MEGTAMTTYRERIAQLEHASHAERHKGAAGPRPKAEYYPMKMGTYKKGSAMKRQPPKKRFAVGAEVRVIRPGVNGVVTQLDDEPAALGEYWHRIKTKHGERREPGCNLELIPKPMGEPPTQTDIGISRAKLIEYFRGLEKVLDEYRQQGKPAGDSAYQELYQQLGEGLATLGFGKDQFEEVASDCGHGSTLEQLEKLRKKPIGF